MRLKLLQLKIYVHVTSAARVYCARVLERMSILKYFKRKDTLPDPHGDISSTISHSDL